MNMYILLKPAQKMLPIYPLLTRFSLFSPTKIRGCITQWLWSHFSLKLLPQSHFQDPLFASTSCPSKNYPSRSNGFHCKSNHLWKFHLRHKYRSISSYTKNIFHCSKLDVQTKHGSFVLTMYSFFLGAFQVFCFPYNGYLNKRWFDIVFFGQLQVSNFGQCSCCALHPGYLSRYWERGSRTNSRHECVSVDVYCIDGSVPYQYNCELGNNLHAGS